MNKIITIHSLAGYCFEAVLWKMLFDLTKELLDKTPSLWKVLTPNAVTTEGEDFHLTDNDISELAKKFYPPEGIENLDEAGVIWSMGALICYASSGHYIFGGRGGAYQRNHPHVELPTLRKIHSSLTPIVQRCLCYSPSQRISLKELFDLAAQGFDNCEKKARIRVAHPISGTIATPDIPDDTWPEKMS